VMRCGRGKLRWRHGADDRRSLEWFGRDHWRESGSGIGIGLSGSGFPALDRRSATLRGAIGKPPLRSPHSARASRFPVPSTLL
jgi:hypothetical protein